MKPILEDNLHEISKPIFWGKKSEKKSKCRYFYPACRASNIIIKISKIEMGQPEYIFWANISFSSKYVDSLKMRVSNICCPHIGIKLFFFKYGHLEEWPLKIDHSLWLSIYLSIYLPVFVCLPACLPACLSIKLIAVVLWDYSAIQLTLWDYQG